MIAWRERRDKHRRVLVQITAGTLDGLTVLIVGQAVHDKSVNRPRSRLLLRSELIPSRRNLAGDALFGAYRLRLTTTCAKTLCRRRHRGP